MPNLLFRVSERMNKEYKSSMGENGKRWQLNEMDWYRAVQDLLIQDEDGFLNSHSSIV
jgi:hypothetical protein